SRTWALATTMRRRWTVDRSDSGTSWLEPSIVDVGTPARREQSIRSRLSTTPRSTLARSSFHSPPSDRPPVQGRLILVATAHVPPCTARGVDSAPMRRFLILLLALPASAQAVLAPTEDATIAPKGALRFGIETSWQHYQGELTNDSMQVLTYYQV